MPQGSFTLQIISSTSLEVSPGLMTVRAGWLLGRQNHEGVKYSCTQISQSGLCWWTLLRATSFSLCRDKIHHEPSQPSTAPSPSIPSALCALSEPSEREDILFLSSG